LIDDISRNRPQGQQQVQSVKEEFVESRSGAVGKKSSAVDLLDEVLNKQNSGGKGSPKIPTVENLGYCSTAK
jgi:hypothetical protein